MTATPEMIPTDLTLEIGSDLSPEQFMAAARAFFGYVNELADEADLRPSDRWIVRVREGSTLLALDPNPSVPIEVVHRVYKRAAIGVERLANNDLENSGLPEGALKHLKVLSEMTDAAARKTAPVSMRLWVEKKPISLIPAIAGVIREEGRADYNDYGTIEGRLETIAESNGSLLFNIHDVTLRQKVRCYFPEGLLTEVFDKFRKRVEVSGVIHYRKNGTPISIAAERITDLPDDSELPTASDVRGIFLN
jgi:hypothetical protein